jgi:hypothetical protein
VQGSYRNDLELAGRAPGPLRLRRKLGARVVSIGLAAAALAAGAFDLFARRPGIALAQLLLAVAFAALVARAELDSWRFDGEDLVRRTFSLRQLRFREVRLRARSIAGIGIARAQGSARAWVETRSGQRYALVEGEAGEVERIADGLRRAVHLAAIQPGNRTLH